MAAPRTSRASAAYKLCLGHVRAVDLPRVEAKLQVVEKGLAEVRVLGAGGYTIIATLAGEVAILRFMEKWKEREKVADGLDNLANPHKNQVVETRCLYGAGKQ